MSTAMVKNLSRSAVRLGLAAAMLCASTAPALAAGATFTVSVEVQADCFVNAPSDIEVNDGGSATGTAVEACNSGGYTVTANYRELASDEGAVLQYNGQTIDLPADGQVIVHVSTMADIKPVAYALQSTHLDQPLALSFNVQPA